MDSSKHLTVERAVSVSLAGKDNTPGIANLLKALMALMEKLAAGATLGPLLPKRWKVVGEAESDSEAKERSEVVKCLQKATNAPKKGDGGSCQKFLRGPAPNGEAAVGVEARTAPTKISSFLERLQISSLLHGAHSPKVTTTHSISSESSGVRNGIDIPFMDV